ncbi:hypothetical protein GCM10027341_21210 [Spirosoma knui]
MKPIVSLLLLLSATAFAQVKLPTNEAGQVQYQEIARMPDANRPARQVYNQIREWASEHYTAENEAELQHDDVHGILFVRSFYPIGKRNIRYTLTVEARIGRYRATITDLVAEDEGITLPLLPTSSTVDDLKKAANGEVKSEQVLEQIAQDQAELYQEINSACRATLASLKESLTAPAAKK